MALFPIRWPCILTLATLLIVGCGNKEGEKEGPPRNPLLGQPQPGAGGLRRVADRPKVRNDLNQLYTFYDLFVNDMGHAPKTIDELKEYIKKDARQLHQALTDGYYGVVVGKRPTGNGVLAYENAPDDVGDHIVIRADHSFDTLKTDDLKKALQVKN